MQIMTKFKSFFKATVAGLAIAMTTACGSQFKTQVSMSELHEMPHQSTATITVVFDQDCKTNGFPSKTLEYIKKHGGRALHKAKYLQCVNDTLSAKASFQIPIQIGKKSLILPSIYQQRNGAFLISIPKLLLHRMRDFKRRNKLTPLFDNEVEIDLYVNQSPMYIEPKALYINNKPALSKQHFKYGYVYKMRLSNVAIDDLINRGYYYLFELS